VVRARYLRREDNTTGDAVTAATMIVAL
jgi:hypothetical protein